VERQLHSHRWQLAERELWRNCWIYICGLWLRINLNRILDIQKVDFQRSIFIATVVYAYSASG